MVIYNSILNKSSQKEVYFKFSESMRNIDTRMKLLTFF